MHIWKISQKQEAGRPYTFLTFSITYKLKMETANC
jgi:hypothetical protein